MGISTFNTKHGIILCKTKISNKRQSMFLKMAVDTGASFTMISYENAFVIGIDPSKSRNTIEITTANGIVIAPLIKIPSFMCLGIEIKNMYVTCHNLPPESNIDGLLGLDFLKAAQIIIDFSRDIIKTAE